MIGVGVTGYGYWGANIVRNFAEAAGFRLLAVCDPRKERQALVRSRYPGVKVFDDVTSMLRQPEIDAVAVVTPVSTHYPLGLQVLESGRHLLIEKPMTATHDEALRLIEAADRARRVLMVDHTFVYTGAVRKMSELARSGALGDIHYYDSVRVNLGLFQHDVNVIWDLAVHDLSIMHHVLPKVPAAISATGASIIPGGQANIAYLTLFFDDGAIGHIHVNWLAPVKVRRTLIGGSLKMIVYDDLEPSEKVKVYDKGITVHDDAESIHRMRIGYRAGDMWSPQIDLGEALSHGIAHFGECIASGSRPVTDGQAGAWMVRLLQAADGSLERQGRPIELHQAQRAVS